MTAVPLLDEFAEDLWYDTPAGADDTPAGASGADAGADSATERHPNKATADPDPGTPSRPLL
ncbi:MAG: hypothetical protein ACRDT8_11405 [Micromonosporaceae bacterium]